VNNKIKVSIKPKRRIIAFRTNDNMSESIIRNYFSEINAIAKVQQIELLNGLFLSYFENESVTLEVFKGLEQFKEHKVKYISK